MTIALWPTGVQGHAIDGNGNFKYIVIDENNKPIAVDKFNGFVPPTKKHILSIADVSNLNAVVDHYRNDTDAKFIEDIRDFFSSMVAVPSDEYLNLMVSFIISTCFLDQCSHTPIIWLFAEPGTGKTRFGHLLTYISFFGVRIAGVKEAHVIRYCESYGSLIFFDCTDLGLEMKSRNTVDILLNRFESGVKYMRVNDIKAGQYNDITMYHLFGPTVIATNFGLPDALMARCLRVNMQNSNELFEMSPSPANCLPFKERLLALKLRHAGRSLPPVEKPHASRLGDIVKPLLATCRMVGMDESWIPEMIADQLETKNKGVHAEEDMFVAQAFLNAAKRSPLNFISNELIYAEYCKLEPAAPMTSLQVGMKLTQMGVEKIQISKGRGRRMSIKIIEEFSARFCIAFNVDDYSALDNCL